MDEDEWMGRAPALVLASAVLAGCASGPSPSTSPSTIARPPTTSSAAPSTTTAATARGRAGCVHRPIAHDHDSYYGLAAPGGVSIDFLATHVRTPATDGHGNTMQSVGLSVERTGAQGTLLLTSADPGYEVVFRGFGDFDGDGRTDLLVDVYGAGNDVTYIVSGTVASGTRDPATVGVPVPRPHLAGGTFAGFPAAVGDQNGDGADDVSFGPEVYSGRDLLARSRIGTTRPAPLQTLTSMYAGLVQVDPKAPPSFVVPAATGASLRVLDRRSDRLLLDGSANDLSIAITLGAGASGWLVGGHHIVEYGYSTRSGSTAWRWDLDAACGT